MQQARHSKKRPHKLVTLGVYATAGLAALAAGVPAMASAGTTQPPRAAGTEVHVNTDLALSTASPLHPRDIVTNFSLHEYGDTVGAGAVNRALASSRACTGDEHCSSLAVSFQILLMGGSHLHLQARNVSKATNSHCEGCQSAAGAYQFIVDTPQALWLSQSCRSDLRRIRQELEILESSHADPATLHHQADVLAAQVVATLKRAVAHAPTAPAPTRSGYQPAPAKAKVTLHRLTDGWHPAGN